VVERVREGGAAGPPVRRRVVDLELGLAEIAADHIDPAADLRRRHLGARRWHRRCDRPATAVLRPRIGTEQRPADEQDGGEHSETGFDSANYAAPPPQPSPAPSTNAQEGEGENWRNSISYSLPLDGGGSGWG
jgi:hypothetical protein